jgi:DNA-binding NarL/FixJ family response regulator
MKILLLHNSKNIIQAIKIVLQKFKTCKTVIRSSTLGKKDIKKLNEKLKATNPDILILDEHYLSGQITEASDILRKYPKVTIIVIISKNDSKNKSIKQYKAAGINNFLSYDSAKSFYNEMLILLDKEYLKREVERIIVDIVQLKQRE